MKHLVNGVETELKKGTAEVSRWQDRWVVRTSAGTATAVAIRQGDKTLISFRGRVYTVEKPGLVRSGVSAHSGEMHAPMPGQIVDVLVELGAEVDAGQKLLVLEAMKTQQPMIAPFAGKVIALPVAKGNQVVEGALLVQVAPHENAE
ncbi:MAG TPA: hypothetical protein PLO61_01875 [Fimbriimonadaceae bacterium]|nr:hypothetical protein [Fimbriimonadaceae bacterium]HRJ32275.1 hypothetical protein [Fimbriimonadaceae bacterium]